jgi:histidinol-phosphate aminotransferase
MEAVKPKNFIDLAVPGVRLLKPYVPGKPVEELERQYGVKNAIKLASNENPLGASPKALDAIRANLTQLERYPDDSGYTLKHLLAQKHGVAPEQITLGNGSSNLLELAARVFVAPGDEVVFSQYSFLLYPIIVQAIGARAVVPAAKNFGHDLDAMLAAVNERTKLIFIANPNNPTGTWLTRAALEHFIAAVPERVMIVMDEAYFEFGSDLGLDDYADATQWLTRFPNVIVTRTFSKAYGLAGLRIGYGISHPEIADLLGRVRAPFNVNSLALVAARAALDDHAHLERTQQTNTQGLTQLARGLAQAGFAVVPSAANFVCVNVGKSAAQVYEDLLREGVIVRPVAGLGEHLRITIGLPGENERVIAALVKVARAH